MTSDELWRQPIEGQLGLLDVKPEPEPGCTESRPGACSHRGEWPCHDCIGRFPIKEQKR